MKHIKAHIVVPDTSSFGLKKTMLTPETYKIHSHKNFELNYIVYGSGTRIVGDSIESFSRGDLVLLGPDLPHCWEVKSVKKGVDPECITIHFHEDFVGLNIMKSPELKPVISLLNDSYSGIQFSGRVASKAGDIMYKMTEANKLRRLIYLFEIFELLISAKTWQVLARPGYFDDTKKTQSDKLNKVFEFIMVNFTEKVYLKEVADLCHMSPSAFCRFFESATGTTLFNYLKGVRIGYACKLLQDSEYSVTSVCYQSGYNNLAHFNNQFKEICGVSPGKYRKNLSDLEK